MDYLMQDPRPEVIQDSGLWQRLFRQCVKMGDQEKGMMLLRRFWTMRSIGTMLRPTKEGKLRFEPMTDGAWGDEYEDLMRRYIGPFSKDVNDLLREVLKGDPI